MDLCLVGFGFTLLFLDLLIRLALCCQRQQLARSLPCQKPDEKAEREGWRAFLEFHTGERAGQYTTCKIDSNNNVFTGENNPIVFCRPLPSLPRAPLSPADTPEPEAGRTLQLECTKHGPKNPGSQRQRQQSYYQNGYESGYYQD